VSTRPEILADNSWKVEIQGRKGLGSFQIPTELVVKYGFVNGDIVSCSIYQNGIRKIVLPKRKLTSGCEVYVPKAKRSKLNKSIPVEIRIDSEKISGAIYEDLLEDIAGYEGKTKISLHRTKERNRFVVNRAKAIWKRNDPQLHCSVCEFSFVETYGYEFIEAHHVVPINSLTKETVVSVKDLVSVCSNCHRMLHRKSKILTVEELKQVLVKE
jgi:predicted HNH restriction endonuclease